MMDTRAEQLEAAFRRFHVDNPRIWQLFEKFALEVSRTGRRHYSSAAIFERIRWHIEIETSDGECKLNNNHKPFYSRLFHQRHPELGKFFLHREMTTKNKPAVEPEKHFFLSPQDND